MMPFPILRLAMTPGTDTVTWREIMGELMPVINAPLTPEGEQLLLDVIHYNGEIHVGGEDLPHSLSPTEMLKSLAIQGLGRWTGQAYLADFQQVELSASGALKDVIRAVIKMTAQRT